MRVKFTKTIKKILKKILIIIQKYFTLIFLISSMIIMQLTLYICNQQNLNNSDDTSIEINTINTIEEDIEEKIMQNISDEVYYIMFNNNISSYKLFSGNGYFYYEIYNNDINEKYNKEMPDLENNICEICSQIKNILLKYNIKEDVEVSIVNLKEDRVYLSSLNGKINFTIYDKQVKHMANEDTDSDNWKYL